tara:strand:- start:3708 stop:4169 length:462 start_codon:yes stop_codon:yes gene_type:complete
MDKSMLMQVIVVMCLAHTGYRRAGLAFNRGENRYAADDLSESQLAQIKADPRLKVSTVEEDAQTAQATLSPGTLAAISAADGVTGSVVGVQDNDGKDKPLNELTVAELKELAKDMDIPNLGSLKKSELVSAIEAVKVSVAADDIALNTTNTGE